MTSWSDKFAQLGVALSRLGHRDTLMKCAAHFGVSVGSAQAHTMTVIDVILAQLDYLIRMPRNPAEVLRAQRTFFELGTGLPVCPGFMLAGDGSLIRLRVPKRDFDLYNSGRKNMTCVNAIMARAALRVVCVSCDLVVALQLVDGNTRISYFWGGAPGSQGDSYVWRGTILVCEYAVCGTSLHTPAVVGQLFARPHGTCRNSTHARLCRL